MAVVGNLVANLSLNSSSLTAGLNKGLGSIKSFVSSGRGLIAGLAAGVAGYLSASAFASYTSGAMNAIDATAKTSDRLGILTEDLIGLRHAADLAGVGNSEFDASLLKMQKSIGSAALKGGPAAAALQHIGLTAAEVANMGAADQFSAIAQGISEIENPAERAAIATAIFGKQGQALINTMSGGAAGLEAAQMEAEKLGITLSRVDAAKVEAANDSWTKFSSMLGGIWNQVAVQLSPALKAFWDYLVEVGTSGGGVGSLVASGFEMAVSAIAFAADMVDVLVVGWYGLRAAVMYVGAAILEAVIGGINAFSELLSSSWLVQKAVQGIQIVWYGVQSAALTAVMAIVKGIKWLVEAVNGVLPASAQMGTSFLENLNKGLEEQRNKAADNLKAVIETPTTSVSAPQWLKDLSSNMSAAAATAGEDLQKKLVSPSYGENVKSFFENLNQSAEDSAIETAAGLQKPVAELDSTGFDKKGSKGKKSDKLEFVAAGSKEAYERIQAAISGSRPDDKTTKALDKSNQFLSKMVGPLNQIAENTAAVEDVEEIDL